MGIAMRNAKVVMMFTVSHNAQRLIERLRSACNSRDSFSVKNSYSSINVLIPLCAMSHLSVFKVEAPPGFA